MTSSGVDAVRLAQLMVAVHGRDAAWRLAAVCALDEANRMQTNEVAAWPDVGAAIDDQQAFGRLAAVA